ncbi:hypothetical protein ACTXT7_003206 [Hymenolepis weldensis]
MLSPRLNPLRFCYSGCDYATFVHFVLFYFEERYRRSSQIVAVALNWKIHFVRSKLLPELNAITAFYHLSGKSPGADFVIIFHKHPKLIKCLGAISSTHLIPILKHDCYAIAELEKK